MQPDNQENNRTKHLWKKGQSGNPKGRPKGKTLKEYAREYLACMTDEERDDFMDGLPKELIWKMSEGNPKQDTELFGKVEQTVTNINIVQPNGNK
jgi:hypothetical protein